MNAELNPAEREFLIQLRSLLLKCVDLIERRAMIGKYRPTRAIPHSPTETIAGFVRPVKDTSHEPAVQNPSVR